MKQIFILVLISLVTLGFGAAGAQDVCGQATQDGVHAHHSMDAQRSDKTQPQSSDAEMAAAHGHDHHSQSGTFIDEILEHGTSGTSAQPESVQQPMIMLSRGSWMLMFHHNVFFNVEQQSGPSGGDKVFSTNWFMPMAQRAVGPGQFTLRAMISLEPATVTGRLYPELFQQGETAFGKAIANGQHPHNFFMEVAALYDWKLADRALLSFYAALPLRKTQWRRWDTIYRIQHISRTTC